MKSVLAIANQKGGVGKTTSAAALAIALSRAGERVHLIDMDPQASLTSAFSMRDDEGLLFRAFKSRSELPVINLDEHLSLTPSSIDLARGESEFLGEPAREYILQTSLKKTRLPERTLVILDCPPSLGLLAVNCLTAADYLTIVVHPGGFELRALVHLQDTVGVLKERINPDLKLLGAILTKCDMREKITEVVRQEVGRVYNLLGIVRSDTQLKYACTDGTMLYLRDSHALVEYRAIAEKIRTTIWTREGSPA